MVSCPSGNYKACLIEQFNIKIAGNATDSRLQSTYQGLRMISPYPAFYSAFKRGGITITYENADTCSAPYWCAGSGAWAFVDTYGDMFLFNNIWNSSQGQVYVNYFMTHEGAHTADDYMGNANNNLYYNAYTLEKDIDCFDSFGAIKTYPSASFLGTSASLQRRKNKTLLNL